MHDPKDCHVVIFDPIDDNVFTDWEAPEADPKIFIATTTKVWMSGKPEEPICNRINELVRSFEAAAFLGDVIPNVVEVSDRLRRDAVSHQRDLDRSAASRDWPRFCTSAASSRMVSCVMIRPSPRATAASASWSVATNSARLRSRSSHKDRASSIASSTR
jgi:hypothetical protein